MNIIVKVMTLVRLLCLAKFKDSNKETGTNDIFVTDSSNNYIQICFVLAVGHALINVSISYNTSFHVHSYIRK